MWKRLLLVAAVVLAGIYLHGIKEASADKTCSIPAAWGPLRSVTFSTNAGAWDSASLYFEDAQGTIREVYPGRCKVIHEITRTP